MMSGSPFTKELIERCKHDLHVRQRLLEEGTLQEIIAQIGWPTPLKVGKEASEAAWLIVQHAIGLPAFMKSCLVLMNEPDNLRDIDPVTMAFLADRIAMFEDRPQSYGTQFERTSDGQLTPYQLDASVADVNHRRRQLGLDTLEERLTALRSQEVINPKGPPKGTDWQRERDEYDAWRRKVGWLSA